MGDPRPSSARRVGHPAPFPVELPERLIELYTYRDDVVLDPFLGSGSTAVAAVRTDRRYVGYDTDPGYVRPRRGSHRRRTRRLIPADGDRARRTRRARLRQRRLPRRDPTKRLPTVTVLLVSQSFGLAAATLLVVTLRDSPPPAHIFVLSAASGVVLVIALGLLFRGLALGRMSIVAPLSAIGGGVLPVVWGLLRGERPSGLALAGVGVALVAAAIVGGGAEHDPAAAISPRLEMALGAGAGVGFGVVFILLAESSSGSGMWPVFIARCVSVPLLAVVSVVLGRSPRVPRATLHRSPVPV